MQILFTRFPLESAYGGAEVQTLTLAEGLRKKGHTVAFLGNCPTLRERFQVSSLRQGFPLRSSSFEGQVGRQAGFRCQELSIGPPPVTKWGVVSFLWRKREMRRKLIEGVTTCFVVRRAHHDVNYGEHDMCIFMLSLSEKLLLTEWVAAQGIKVFWIEHDRIGRWLTMNPWLPRLRKLSTLATTIVVSDLSRDLYLKLGWDPKKTVSIPNGIDVGKFAARDVLRQAQHDVFNVGCIARLTHDKGVDLLIEAVSGFPNVHLTIVGQGREEKKIRALIDQANHQASKRVNLLPTIDPQSFYPTLDVLVLPSREHDPFGLVAAEAMAAGVPMIVTDVCGIARHLTQNEDALIVPAGSAQALRNAVKTLQEFPQIAKKLSERGSIVAHERFSKERMVEEYERLLKR